MSLPRVSVIGQSIQSFENEGGFCFAIWLQKERDKLAAKLREQRRAKRSPRRRDVSWGGRERFEPRRHLRRYPAAAVADLSGNGALQASRRAESLTVATATPGLSRKLREQRHKA